MSKSINIINDPFHTQARAIMDRHDLPESAYASVRGELVQKAFLQEIEPFVKQIAEITGMAMPAYALHHDGRMERSDDGLSEKLRTIVSEYRAHIEEVRAKYYGFVELG